MAQNKLYILRLPAIKKRCYSSSLIHTKTLPHSISVGVRRIPNQLVLQFFCFVIEFCMDFSGIMQSLFNLDFCKGVEGLHARFTQDFESRKQSSINEYHVHSTLSHGEY